VWPQLAYLLWVALVRAGEDDAAEVVRTTSVAGAVESGLAEYWNGDTGAGLGAIPQSWTGLALLMARAGG
jgi:glycogen debranching enzyme